MSLPIFPLLPMALLVAGIGAYLWGLYLVDKESEATSKIIAALFVRPDNTLER